MLHRLISPGAARPLLYLALVLSSISPSVLASVPRPSQQEVVASPVDPDKEASELNHRIAGGFLLAIGFCIIGSERYKSLAWLRWLPPILFIAAGVFLAAWSDNEIWPRGDLSWSWLAYDAEARQHKLYALLLIGLGLVEAIQANGKSRRPWLSIVFPVLGLIGGVSLLFHHHSGQIAASAAGQSLPSLVQDVQFSAVPSPAYTHEHHQHGAGAPDSSAGSPMKVDAAETHQESSHHHHMAGPQAKIQREHTWFAMVGFCIALLKFLSDSKNPPIRVGKYLWASSLLLLGLSLLFYTE